MNNFLLSEYHYGDGNGCGYYNMCGTNFGTGYGEGYGSAYEDGFGCKSYFQDEGGYGIGDGPITTTTRRK